MSGEGPGRTTVGQSDSGDLYAGHDGNVYKKADDGWQHYDNGQWAQTDASRAQSEQRERSSTTRDSSQLNRDYAARQRGDQQFQQRSTRAQRGGMSRRR